MSKWHEQIPREWLSGELKYTSPEEPVAAIPPVGENREGFAKGLATRILQNLRLSRIWQPDEDSQRLALQQIEITVLEALEEEG